MVEGGFLGFQQVCDCGSCGGECKLIVLVIFPAHSGQVEDLEVGVENAASFIESELPNRTSGENPLS
jgi:hypothetical protein